MDYKETLNKLKDVNIFKNVPDEQLEWLLSKGTVIDLKEGEALFKKDSALDTLFIILQGKIDLRLKQNGDFRSIAEVDEKSVTGILPYSRAKKAISDGIAVKQAEVLAVSNTHFHEMIKNHFELTQSLVHHMTSRVREFTRQQQQNDKMVSLGKLSAGLAHEINNPSAAVMRNAAQLKTHITALPKVLNEVLASNLNTEEANVILDFLARISECDQNENPSLLEKASYEEDLFEWFDKYGMADAEKLVESFSCYNIKKEHLQELKDKLSEHAFTTAIKLINELLIIQTTSEEIEASAKKINELVISIKSYTHMDQSPEKEPADIHEGIENTLTLLKHKIKKHGVQLQKDYQHDLAKPRVNISALNQVWTNLIDNALDAMENSDKKNLKILTRQEGEHVKISIEDSGSGIPEKIMNKIFDPFFTTKDIGKGTGLGLDVVQQIVNQHNGKIEIESKPGQTLIEIRLPIN